MSPRVAVVTGASRGIGKQFCVDLAKAHTGHVHSIRELRARGIVRPVTNYRDFAS